jgi:hypothetical protein
MRNDTFYAVLIDFVQRSDSEKRYKIIYEHTEHLLMLLCDNAYNF